MTPRLSSLNIALVVALLLSSFWLIGSSHESRRLFVALDRARAQASELQIEFERLQVDKRAQATPLRIEKLAAAHATLLRPAQAGRLIGIKKK